MNKRETTPQSPGQSSHYQLTYGQYKRNSPQSSIKPSGEPTKERAVSPPNGDHTKEEEPHPAEEEAIHPQQVHLPEGIQPPPDLTSPLTYDLFPPPTMRHHCHNSLPPSMRSAPHHNPSYTN